MASPTSAAVVTIPLLTEYHGFTYLSCCHYDTSTHRVSWLHLPQLLTLRYLYSQSIMASPTSAAVITIPLLTEYHGFTYLSCCHYNTSTHRVSWLHLPQLLSLRYLYSQSIMASPTSAAVVTILSFFFEYFSTFLPNVSLS